MPPTPPAYQLPPTSPTSEYSSQPSFLDIDEVDTDSFDDDLLPPSDYGYLPTQQEHLPAYPSRPSQYVFLSLDVLNSAVVNVANGEHVMESRTDPGGEETEIRLLGDSGSGDTDAGSSSGTSSVSPSGQTICRVYWSGKSGPSLDFGSGRLLLRKWMMRTGHPSALLHIQHRGVSYDVYQAGSAALGVRLTPTKARQNTRSPMLLGIRDPLKHTELLLSPGLGREAADGGADQLSTIRELLEIGGLMVVLLKSKRPLGADFEEKRLRDKVWRGVDRCFRSIGNAQRGQVLQR